MSRFFSHALLCLLLASAWAGCAGRRCNCIAGSGVGSTPAAPLPPTATLAARGKIAWDLAALPSYEEVDQALPPPASPVQYRVVTATEAQCLAAANAPTAKLLVAESEAVMSNGGGRGRLHRAAQRAATVQSRLLAIRAIDERNKAAGMTLELFYSLAEAEASRDLLAKSIEEVDRAVANVEQLKGSGLKMPLDPSALERQKLDWFERSVQLTATIRHVQGQLQQLLGFELDETMPVWPEVDLSVSVAPINAGTAVTEGLAHRADVAALRMLAGNLDADTLPAARSGMQAISPGLGLSAGGDGLFGGSDQTAEASTRQSQVQQALTETQRTTTREIHDAVAKLETSLREIALAKQRWEQWKDRAADLQEKHASDDATAFDLTTAQLELLHAESDAVHRIIAWKIAQAKLAQSQGLLAAQCGYCLP